MAKEAKLLPVHVLGDNILRTKCEPVTVFDKELQEFAHDLVYTMYRRDGVGFAANQGGRNICMFAMDTEWGKEEGKPHPRVLINPKIISAEGEYEYEEGCISVPGVYAKVKRYQRITYSYQDLDGKMHEETAEDFEAVVIQHETDHLNALLFIDHLSSLARLKLKLKLREIEKTSVNGVNIRQDIFVATD